jgi:rhodanese-related sulfurtransferase
MEPAPTRVAVDRVRELLASGAQLVEVLPRREYEEQHLPGAVSVPLKELGAGTVAGLDRATPVVVYCWDSI